MYQALYSSNTRLERSHSDYFIFDIFPLSIAIHRKTAKAIEVNWISNKDWISIQKRYIVFWKSTSGDYESANRRRKLQQKINISKRYLIYNFQRMFSTGGNKDMWREVDWFDCDVSSSVPTIERIRPWQKKSFYTLHKVSKLTANYAWRQITEYNTSHRPETMKFCRWMVRSCVT